MKHGSLFSGIGGFDLAAEWMSWENVFQCEKEEFCQRVLRFYWPKARLYGDVREFDAKEYRGVIDVLSGGFPCQPFSIAGKRKGAADERYLWPEMCRVINEIRPRWVVGENVLGLLNWQRGMVFEQVQADLETAGYEVWSYILPAAGIGAPHRRERVWIVAHAGGDGCGGDPESSERGRMQEKARIVCEYDLDALHGRGIIADAETSNGFEGGQHRTRGEKAGGQFGRFYSRGEGNSWQDFPTESPVCVGDDGVSDRLDGITFPSWWYHSLHGAGNAVVPGVVMQIFGTIKWIDSRETQRNESNS